MSFLVTGSSKRRPIRRLTAKTVLSGLVTAWRLAGWPTSLSPSLAKATTDGVVRAPSEFSMTLGLPPSITATQLLVVPRSIPITLAIGFPTSLLQLDAARRSPVPWQDPSAARLRGGYRCASGCDKGGGRLHRRAGNEGEERHEKSDLDGNRAGARDG